MAERLGTVRDLIQRSEIPLVLSFTVPALFRALPEVLAGPYPIGFDTITWYAPLVAEAQRGGAGVGLDLIIQSQRAPLLNVLLVIIAAGLPLPPIAILKGVAPLLMGFFSVSTYLFVRSVFGLNRSSALIAALFVAFYFVTLRLALDLFRNLLGYTLFLLTLREIHRSENRENHLVVGALVLLTYLTHELVGILLLVIVVYLAARGWMKEQEIRISYLVHAVTGFIALAYYAHWLVPPNGTVLGNIPVVPTELGMDYIEQWNSRYDGIEGLYMSILVMGVLVLVPLVPLAMKSPWSRGSIAVWTAFLLTAGLSPLILPKFAAPLWHRWLFMAAVPLSILAGLRVATYSRRSILAVGLALGLVASGYAFLPVEYALPPFAIPYTTEFLPSSMMQNTGPLQDSPSIIAALQWLSENAPSDSLLLAHIAFTGWAQVFSPRIPIQTYFQLSSVNMSEFMTRDNVYLIWWSQNIGWYPDERIDPGFLPIHQVGRISIFRLIKS